MSLATGNQDHSRADHEQTAEDVEDRGTDATGAGEFLASIISYSSFLFKVYNCVFMLFNRKLPVSSFVKASRHRAFN